jgi:hypothetical protein
MGSTVSNRTRLLTIILGATALAGLTYGVTRRGFQRRAMQSTSSASQALLDTEPSAPPASAPSTTALDWETLSVQSTRGSTPDPLDVAMSLEGLFDGESEDGNELTVRPDVHVPLPLGGDDEEAPGAEDLGVAWLMQATQSEHALREADLRTEIENIALAEEVDFEEIDEESDGADEHDEHESFQRTRA